MRGCIAATQADEAIKAIIMKESKIIGIISGKQEYSNIQ
jgi:hypothetical protein